MELSSSVYTTLVLVTDQFECERIIKAARVIADISQTELMVLSVMKTGAETNPAALEYLFGVAKEYGGQMALEFSDSPQSTIVHFMRKNRVVNAITGLPKDEGSILVRMWKTLLNIRFFTVTEQGELHEVVSREYENLKANAVKLTKAFETGSLNNA